MPIYVYKGYDEKTGSARKGKIEADSIRSARQQLKTRERINAFELKEEVALEKNKSEGAFQLNSGSNNVSLQELSVMTRQLATLQQAHVPLEDCLKAMTSHVEHRYLRNTLANVRTLVSEGKSLADALGQHRNVFDRLYCNMVRAGESSGALGLVLERLADYQEYQVGVRGKVMSAMAYPVMMIGASLAVMSYLFISVVPKLEKVFQSLKVALPWYTRGVIGVSDFLQTRWYVLIILAIVGTFGFKVWYQSKEGRKKFDTWILRFYVIGPIVIRLNVSKFTKTLSTLLGSGVPIIAALEITKNIISNTVIAQVVEDAKIAVQEGESFGGALEKSDVFPSLVTHMVHTGERTGDLESMLAHVANAYDAEVERKISAMISLIEPLMIILMAGIIAIVVIALLVPMLSIMGSMR
ncbi:MAG: type II secretion system F family protein [Oligoflexales bacterium]